MRLATIVVCVVFLATPCLVQADISRHLSYQGVLRDDEGNPVPNGNYDFTFSLYDSDSGGTRVWTEDLTLPVRDGIYNAILGESQPLMTLAWDVPYWLAISVEGGAELSPRVELTTVPYAAHAGYADTCLEGDDDWTADGDDVYHDVGNVGIGTTAPAVALDVDGGAAKAARFENDAGMGDFTTTTVNLTGTAGAFYSGTNPTGYPSIPAAIYGYGYDDSRGGHFSSATGDGIYSWSSSGKAVYGKTSTGYSGYFSGGLGVYCGDMLETDEFKMATGAASGRVLTADAGGVGTWQAPAAVADGDWTIDGDNIYCSTSGNVGIGETYPLARLEIEHHPTSATRALRVATSTSANSAIIFSRTVAPSGYQSLLALTLPSDTPDDAEFIDAWRGVGSMFKVGADGSVTAAGKLKVSGADSVQAQFRTSAVGDNVAAIAAYATASSTDDQVGVYGESAASDGHGIGGVFVGGFLGARGSVSPPVGASGAHIGVNGDVMGGSGDNYGLRGYVEWGHEAYGVYGYAAYGDHAYGVYGYAGSASVSNYAGYFAGDTHVTGELTAGTKSFKIDHPLDPEHKYLMHSCVDSDDMMNIYNGNVTLDGKGEAWVSMPDWFEALNRDFRYQLTPIGAPGPNLYVAEKISGGRFLIAGGEPGMEVSWQVTGIRHDPLAETNRVQVETYKRPDEVGKYMHPDAYGMPRTMGIDYKEERAGGSS
jgi:hypothetical protein